MRLTTVLLLSALLGITGCASKPKVSPERTEAGQYQAAQRQIEKKNFLTAVDELRELEARFPYGDYAEQGLLDLVYVYYRAYDYPASIAAATRFLRNYPANPHLDYVLYMRGLGNYNLERGLFERLLRTEKSSRDLDAWRDAFRDLNELVRRYPDSPYTPDARARLVHIRNTMADGELHAARYYARRGAYVAAAARAKEVIIHYQETPAVEEALAVQYRAYRALGEKQLADTTLSVLKYNWPESQYLASNDRVVLPWWPDRERGLLSLLTFDLL
ncbi:outer membrane protein assembly factor BamD [Isoalcanivorax beigongshangi]|uniref:Outer membrane protein assembly factor BamD n=1 Tax=Isoalcanivorax beigongshangi TaxID=3238810 RepID=A0ABV4AK38_9GAMM